MACLKPEHLTVFGQKSYPHLRQAFRAEDRRTCQPKDAVQVFEAAKMLSKKMSFC